MVVELTLVAVGGALTAVSAATGLGVRRLLKSHDELKASHDTLTKTVGDQGTEIAAMKVKMPNGEWRAIKDDVAALHTGVNSLNASLAQHILDETQMLADVRGVVSKCQVVLARDSRKRARR